MEAAANSIMDGMNAAMVENYKAKIKLGTLERSQGPWTRKTIINLWYVHGTEMGTMLKTLIHVRKMLEVKQIVIHGEQV